MTEIMSVVPISSEARERFIEMTGIEPTSDMKLIPDDIIGLGYQWYPMVIISNSKENLDQAMKQIKYVIPPCINTFRGSDMTKEASYAEIDVSVEIMQDSISIVIFVIQI